MSTTTGISHLNLNAELTPRQYKICEQVILGHTHDEASTIFVRSTFTIINTLRACFRKTGARNIQELSVWYYCKKFGAAIDFSHPMRRIVPMILTMLVSLEVFVGAADLRSRIRKGRRDEYECINECFERPISTFVAVAEGIII